MPLRSSEPAGSTAATAVATGRASAARKADELAPLLSLLLPAPMLYTVVAEARVLGAAEGVRGLRMMRALACDCDCGRGESAPSRTCTS